LTQIKRKRREEGWGKTEIRGQRAEIRGQRAEGGRAED
jgi:hypothetical protein